MMVYCFLIEAITKAMFGWMEERRREGRGREGKRNESLREGKGKLKGNENMCFDVKEKRKERNEMYFTILSF